jgi:hypothetical protein
MAVNVLGLIVTTFETTVFAFSIPKASCVSPAVTAASI